MKRIYESFDGKIFESEEECLAHEFAIIGDGLQLYDKDGYITANIKEACVVYIKNEVAYELFCHLDHLNYPKRNGKYAGPGINYYSWPNDEWHRIPQDCLPGLTYLLKIKEVKRNE
uniref:Uncharacterized protein n=1 Tax=Myoviridae sp. ctj3P51 TaxID=2826687 RepID=A0A8S5NQ66_9CAUD|nr:MAG TPA: hypothetical protein [Myoviridae sp. ctj3P51]